VVNVVVAGDGSNAVITAQTSATINDDNVSSGCTEPDLTASTPWLSQSRLGKRSALHTYQAS
jgi:hypothetical protein